MKNKLILHIGTHKTGTTSIQNYLRYNKSIKGYKYIDYEECNNGEIFNILKVKRNYIASFEGFSGDMHSSLDLVYDKLLSFREFQSDYDIQIVVFYREQVDFLKSAYAQCIHEGANITFDEYIKCYDLNSLNYCNHIALINEALPKSQVTVNVYSGNHTLKDFFSAIGFDAPVDYIARKNVSYNAYAIEFAKKYNGKLTPLERRELRFLLQKYESRASGPGFSIKETTAESLRENYRASNNELFKTYKLPSFSLKEEDELVVPKLDSEILLRLLLNLSYEIRGNWVLRVFNKISSLGKYILKRK